MERSDVIFGVGLTATERPWAPPKRLLGDLTSGIRSFGGDEALPRHGKWREGERGLI